MLRQAGGKRGIQADHFAGKVETCEAEHDRLPDSPQPGDPYAAGAVRVELKVGSSSLAQKTQGDVGLAEPCGDQRVDPRAQGTAMRTAWLVVAEIRFRRRARELVRQQGRAAPPRRPA